MNREQLRAYAGRDRSEVERAKRDRWAGLYRDRGPAGTLELGWALAEHARNVRPDWPTDAERAADTADHERLTRLFERARDAFARR